MKKLYLLLIIIFLVKESQSQFAYSVETSYNLAGTYTDLGTGGSVITTSNKDNANSAAQAIGFGFNYNGVVYTHFILNTNGFIKLGTSAAMTAPSAANLAYTYFSQNDLGGIFNSTSTNDWNILAPFNHDLDSSTTATTQYRYQTSGAVGSRVCTIQFRNVMDKNIVALTGIPLPHIQFNAMNFQIKLYEVDRMIEFVYGNFVPTSDTSIFKVAATGIIGNGSAEILAAYKSSSHEYSIALFKLGNYTVPTQGFGFGNNNTYNGKSIPQYAIRPLPDAGRTLRFLPRIANDASVGLIYTKHGSVIPYSSPHTVTARIVNVGTTAMTGIWVKLNVTGSNTYIDSTLLSSLPTATGTNVVFSNYKPLNLGTDLVKISISSDGEVRNNSLTWQQKVSNNEIGYGDSSAIHSNFGWTTGSGIFAAKYHVEGKRRIAKVRALIGFSVTNVGQTVFGVVVDASSNIVGRSADHIIIFADLGKWVEFDIHATNMITLTNDPPPIVSSSDFYAGLAAPGAGYNPMALQYEQPNRVGAYHYHGGVTSGGVYTDIGGLAGFDLFRIAVNAQLDGVSLRLEPITSINKLACATTNQSVSVTVTNLDSLPVDFSRDTLHLEVSTTGPIVQSISTMINSGSLAKNASGTFLITNALDLSLEGIYNVIVEARQYMEVDTVNNYRTMVVNVLDSPGVAIKVSPDSIVCYGVPQVYYAIPKTTGSKMYQWKINGINQGSLTSDSTFSGSLVWGDKVSVDLITDHCTTGTFTIPSNEIMAKINPAPRLINGISVTDSVLEQTQKNYAIGVNPSHSYVWRVSGGTLLGDSTSSAISVLWGGPNTSAFISVEETDGNNCTYNNVLPVVVYSIISVDELANIYLGDAYPNPADQTVNIPIRADVKSEISLQLLDVSGRKVKDIFSGVITGSKTLVINTGDLSSGLYYYKLKTSGGFEKSARLTISH